MAKIRFLDQVPIGVFQTPTNTTNGSFSGSFTGSLFGTASWAINALTASFLSGSVSNAISASYALTASYALNGGSGGGDSNISGTQYFVPLFNSTSSLVTSSIYQSGSYTSIRNSTGPEDPTNPDILYINGEGVDTYNLISAHGNLDGYIQLNVQNYSSGSSASSDIVATADDGDETTGYIDMGINSSIYTASNFVGSAKDAYLYSTGNNLYIGNATPAKEVIIFNGGLDAANNARIIIHDQGTVGINTDQYNIINPPSLVIAAPNTITNTLIEAEGASDSFLQVSIINSNAGTQASSDIVAYNNLDPTNQSFGFIDMGINSSNFNDPTNYPGWNAGDSYLYTDASRLIIGSTATGSINFFIGENPTSGSRFKLKNNNQHEITGSLNVSGSITAFSFTGSLLGTASYATNALSASFATTSSYILNAVSSSYASSSTSASYALSSSYSVSSSFSTFSINGFPYTGSALITGSLGITGSLSLRSGSNLTVNNGLIISSYNTSNVSVGGTPAWTSALRNTALGVSTQGSVTTQTDNTSVGYLSLLGGTQNTAVGAYSSQLNTGIGNTAMGYYALGNQTSDTSYNVAVGYQAMYNSSGSGALFNIGVGYQALYSIRGTSNIGIGYRAGLLGTTGTGNISMGYESGYWLGASANNIILGYQAGGRVSNQDSDNILIGTGAGRSSQFSDGVTRMGSYNIAIGAQSLFSISSSAVGYGSNIAIGGSSLYVLTTGLNNTSIGSGGGNYLKTGSYNTFLGYYAGASITNSTNSNVNNSVAIGSSALYNNSFGIYNVAVGSGALYGAGSVTSSVTFNGGYNTALGTNAGYIVTVGIKNVFIGNDSGTTNSVTPIGSGSYNTFIGNESAVISLGRTYGNYNVGLGHGSFGRGESSGYIEDPGDRNTGLGSSTLSKLSGSTATRNTAVGSNSGRVITLGGYNTLLGSYSGGDLTTGNYNIFIGDSAGRSIISGSNNTIIGQFSSSLGAGTSNLLLIGVGSTPRIFIDATGSGYISGSLAYTGSLLGTASYATTALTASYFSGSVSNAISSSYALTASYATNALSASYFSGSISTAISASYAATASYVLQAISSSFASTASYFSGTVVSSSYAATASIAISSSYPVEVIGTSIIANLQDNSALNPLNTVSSVYIGNEAGSSMINTGSWVIAIGEQAAKNTDTPVSTVFIGEQAGNSAINAIYSNFIGHNAGNSTTNTEYSNFIGSGAGTNSIGSSTSNFIGLNTGDNSTNASFSTFIGPSAGQLSLDADSSNFIGNGAGINSTGSVNSTFIGTSAGASSTDTEFSNFIGYNAGYESTLSVNSNFIGNGAGLQSTGSSHSNFIGPGTGVGSVNTTYSTIIGPSTAQYSVDVDNTFIVGNSAGYQALGIQFSNFIGDSAGQYASGSFYSNFIGAIAGQYSTASYSNFIGYNAGGYTSTSHSLYIGYNAGLNNLNNNNVIIGTNVTLPSGVDSGLNIGGILFGRGLFFDDTNPEAFSGSLSNGKIGINVVDPQYALDVSGSGNFTEGLIITGSISLGDPTAPAVYTSVKTTVNSGSTVIYNVLTSSYDSAFFDYSLKGSSGARAGNIIAMWSGSSVSYTDNSTADMGNTTDFVFGVILSGDNMVLTGSTSTNGWTLKTAVRTI